MTAWEPNYVVLRNGRRVYVQPRANASQPPLYTGRAPNGFRLEVHIQEDP